MSDSDSESITREKKPLSEARLAAIERMKEGRRKSLEEKKKQKELEKEAKKQMKKKIKMKVEEEINGISSLPLEDENLMNELKEKATEPISVATPKKPVLELNEDAEEEEEIIEIKALSAPVKKRATKKKKKIIVNNYYEDDSSESEEEIVNNYHKKKKTQKKKSPKKIEESDSDYEEEQIETIEEYIPPSVSLRQRAYPQNAMSGIVFR